MRLDGLSGGGVKGSRATRRAEQIALQDGRADPAGSSLWGTVFTLAATAPTSSAVTQGGDCTERREPWLDIGNKRAFDHLRLTPDEFFDGRGRQGIIWRRVAS